MAGGKDLEFELTEFARSLMMETDSGITSNDIICAMRQSSPYNFVHSEAQSLIRHSISSVGSDFVTFRKFVGKLITNHIDNYLNEYMEVLRVGNDDRISKYRLRMLLCHELGGNSAEVDEALGDLNEDCLNSARMKELVGSSRSLQLTVARHIFRHELKEISVERNFTDASTTLSSGDQRPASWEGDQGTLTEVDELFDQNSQPDQTLTQPEQSLTQPDQSLTQPDQSATQLTKTVDAADVADDSIQRQEAARSIQMSVNNKEAAEFSGLDDDGTVEAVELHELFGHRQNEVRQQNLVAGRHGHCVVS